MSNDITVILAAIDRGEAEASERLLPLVYEELRRLAAQKLAQERPGQTLSSTALVHEAYLRLVGNTAAPQQWTGRNHFFAAAAHAIHRILVENARRKKSLKRGGQRSAVPLDQIDLAVPNGEFTPEDLLALDEALARLASEDPVKAELVKLRFFAGLSVLEAADILQISRATACRYWDYTRSWLYSELNSSPNNGTPAKSPDP